MKYFITLLVLQFSIKIASAQKIEIPGTKDKIENIKIIKSHLLTKTFPQAKFLYNTEKGKVYALPLDNMPCLVPHINSNMPIAKLDLKEYNKIPNVSPEQKLIPETEILINPPTKNNK